MKISKKSPPSRQGGKLDNGFEEVSKVLRESPNEWVAVEGISNKIAVSLKRSVKLSDMGDSTVFAIRAEDKDKDLYTAYLKYSNSKVEAKVVPRPAR